MSGIRREVFSPAVNLPQTNQSASYSDPNPIFCVGSGRDADVRAGTRMPIPGFLDNSDGPIIDDPESVFLPKPIHGG
jgi:hypothetical protein